MENKALFPNHTASSHESLSEQLADITSKVLRFTSAGGAAIALVAGDVAVTKASAGSLAPDVDARLRLEGSFAGLSIQQGELLYCEDAEVDPRVDSAASASMGIRSMVMVPVGEKGHIRGVLAAFAAQPNGFRPTHIAVMRTLADIVNELAIREEHSHPAPVLEMPVQRTVERPVPVIAPPVQFIPPEPVNVPEPQEIAAAPVLEVAKPVEASAPAELPAAPVVAPEPPPLIKDRFEVPASAPAIIVEPAKTAKDPLPSMISLVNQQKKAEKAITETKSDVLPPSVDPKAVTPSKAVPADSTATAAVAAKKAPVTNQKPLHLDAVVMPVNRAAQAEPMMFRSLEEPASASTVNMKMIVGVLVAILVVAGLGFGVRTFMKSRAQSNVPAAAAIQEAAAPVTDAAATNPAATSAIPAATHPDQTTPPVSKPETEQVAKSAAPKSESSTADQQTKPRQPAVIVAGNGSVTKRTEAVEAPQVALNGKADMGVLLASGKSATPTLSVKRSVLSPPEVIQRVAPKFPEFARRSNPNGDRVVLNATIGADGKVKQVHVIRGQMVFADAAVAAVKQWQYRPAFLNGDAVESTVEVVISFTGR